MPNTLFVHDFFLQHRCSAAVDFCKLILQFTPELAPDVDLSAARLWGKDSKVFPDHMQRASSKIVGQSKSEEDDKTINLTAKEVLPIKYTEIISFKNIFTTSSFVKNLRGEIADLNKFIELLETVDVAQRKSFCQSYAYDSYYILWSPTYNYREKQDDAKIQKRIQDLHESFKIHIRQVRDMLAYFDNLLQEHSAPKLRFWFGNHLANQIRLDPLLYSDSEDQVIKAFARELML